MDRLTEFLFVTFQILYFVSGFHTSKIIYIKMFCEKIEMRFLSIQIFHYQDTDDDNPGKNNGRSEEILRAWYAFYF